MATNATYANLLKRYTPEKLIENEFAKRNYVWQTADKDPNWRPGQTYEFPVLSAPFNTLAMGALPAANDIGEMVTAMGTIQTKEMVASLIFNEKDLAAHGDMEASYLKLVPDRIDALVDMMQYAFTCQALNGGALAMATANGQVGGTIVVDASAITAFSPNMKVEVIDNDTAAVAGYIKTTGGVDLNTNTLAIVTTRGGSTAVDLSTYTIAQGARVQIVGTGSEQFQDLKSALLPASLGGSDTLYGLTKADHMPLQAKRVDGSTWTKATILSDLLGGLFDIRRLGRGKQSEIWVSYGMFKNISLALEVNRQYVKGESKTGYGFTALDILGPDGSAKIVALREMPTNVVYYVDPSAIKFAGFEFFKKKMYNAGEEFFVVRNTTGVQFISDIVLRGNLIFKPAQLGIAYAIPSSVSV